MAKKAKPPAGKRIEAHRHAEAKRRNIPTAEYQSVIQKEAEQPLRVAYERRNRDLDPQLIWRGFLRYSYRGNDPGHRDNARLRPGLPRRAIQRPRRKSDSTRLKISG